MFSCPASRHASEQNEPATAMISARSSGFSVMATAAA